MTRENYLPWRIDPRAFPCKGTREEQLRFMLEFAVLAPSGHNSQPWEFLIKDELILFYTHPDRDLKESDPMRRQLSVSMGCAIENFLIALDYYGFHPTIEYLPERFGVRCLAVVRMGPREEDVSKKEHHLIFSIPKRVTNRGRYKQNVLPTEFLHALSNIIEESCKVAVVSDVASRAALADIAIQSQIEVMDKSEFRNELSHYIKPTYTRSKVGMPGATLNIPAIISLVAPFLIRHVNMSRKTKAQDEELFRDHTPAFVVIADAHDDAHAYLRTGRLLERVWLMAEREGVACAPLAAPVQVGEYYTHVQKVLGTALRPHAFMRIGYPEMLAPHSPRLSVEECIRAL